LFLIFLKLWHVLSKSKLFVWRIVIIDCNVTKNGLEIDIVVDYVLNDLIGNLNDTTMFT
jgi:hypothetical protein